MPYFEKPAFDAISLPFHYLFKIIVLSGFGYITTPRSQKIVKWLNLSE